MEKYKDIILNDNNYITKSKELIKVNDRTSLIEQKFLLCIASNVEQSDSKNTLYTIYINDFRQFLKTKSKSYYHKFYEMCNELQEKYFVMNGVEQSFRFKWFSEAHYNYQEGSVTIKLSPFVREHLCSSNTNGVRYKTMNIKFLRSTYSIKLYEILKLNEKERECSFTLDELKERLGLINKYPSWINFKQKVLDRAQTEITQKTDISFEYVPLKRGRKMSEIKFTISSKNPSAEVNLKEKTNLDEIKSRPQDEASLKSFNRNKIRDHIQSETNFLSNDLNNWLKYGEDKVKAAIQMLDIKKHISANLENLLISEFIEEQNSDKMLLKNEFSFELILKVKAIDKFQKFMSFEEANELWGRKKDKIISELGLYI
ncbi:replication initiation protein [Priestia megaterium]|uniref:RepB family plasmid replication initiator protein n=1 Tax=Priestia megaterium TaxID=1404 RepID=A0A6M6E1V3_PRIMG|nr:replication initiation protein [Priestia megaterium]QJX80922.1 RepB family plasmid replication initiator protein [Priestia megaterium]